MTLAELRDLMARLGHPVTGPLAGPVPESAGTFPGGARCRIEIPYVEGPEELRAALEEADKLGIAIHRAVQHEGVPALDDDEIRQMAKRGAERGVEVILRVDRGPAAGNDAVASCLGAALRACDRGIRGLAVADPGVLSLLGRLRNEDVLPAGLLLKAAIPVANGPAATVCAALGAGSLPAGHGLGAAGVAELRAATRVPLDLHPAHLYETPALIRAAAPAYLVIGAPGDARARVRRAAHVLARLAELDPELMT